MSLYSSSKNQSSVLGKPLQAKKSFGQHFLVNKGVLQKIIDVSEIRSEDTILEIGPGTGLLTRELLQVSKEVYACEVDRDLIADLKNIFSGVESFHLIEKSGLVYEPSFAKYKIVANIPYNISGHFFRHYLEETKCRPEKIVVMIQKEVATKASAKTGDTNLLSLGVQLFGKPRIAFLVKPGSFNPPPSVDSAVLVIDVYEKPLLPEEDIPKFFELARQAFQHKRKQLRVSWKDMISPIVLQKLEGSWDLNRRPESLGVEEWVELYKSLYS